MAYKMASVEDQFIKNYGLFISLYESNDAEKKKLNIEKHLNDGADINAKDANNKGNTSLHIAVQKGESDIVQFLINKGALKNIINSVGKSPCDLAHNLITTDTRTKILEILNTNSERCNDQESLRVHIQHLSSNNITNNVSSIQNNGIQNNKKANQENFYLKRVGTSGVSGHLYETKLLSMVLLRLLNDSEIENFLLGTNVSGIGALDDICVRYTVKKHANPILVFLQAKHREDKDKNRLTVENVRNESGDFSLTKYFESFLKIKESFQTNHEDVLFKGEFNNVECNLIIYTPVKDSFESKRTNIRNTSKEIIGPNELSVKVNSLLQTIPEGIFQYNQQESDITLLVKMTVKERIKKLGTTFLNCIMAEKDKLETMMTNELMKRYHVVLRREVINIFETESNLYQIGMFRPEFFESNSEYLICLKEAFFKDISTTRCDKTVFMKGEINTGIDNLLVNPCAVTISKVISKVVIYNEKTKKLEIIEGNNIRKELKGNRLNQVKQSLNNLKCIDAETIRDAVRIKLESTKPFKLPISFGNIDMTVRGNGAKVSKRLDEVADKIVAKLFKTCVKLEKSNINQIEINDQLIGPEENQFTQGYVDINGGIGGAIGNVLIRDDDTKMIKFDTTNKHPAKANEFLDKMIQRIGKQELEKYRININISGFPQYSFEGDEYDKKQAEDFLNRLWFYTNQAKEDEVEGIVKTNITKLYNTKRSNNQFGLRVHSDEIFLRTHAEIQKWWMLPGKARYLTKDDDYFEQVKREVIDSPLLTLLNLMYIKKLKELNTQFNEMAINALELNNDNDGLHNIVTDANMLCGVKIMQYFHDHQSHTFIEFDYVLSLPLNDYNTLIDELKCTEVQNFIIMYDRQKYYEGLCNKLKQIINTFPGKRIVIVTDTILANEIKEYIKEKYQQVHDNKTHLIDLDEDSQNNILKEGRVIFQGEELPVSSIILDRSSIGLVRSDILLKLLNGEKIVIGRTFLDQTYEKFKDSYVDRYLKREDRVQVDTLDCINDTTVVISATSGMGKSTLLSHLSRKTKLKSPLPWLVRIYLQDYESDFRKWQDENVIIDDNTAIHFMSNAALINNEFQMDLQVTEDSYILIKKSDNIANPVALFELELFINLYNNDKVLFLFDDFNAMIPHYEKEAIRVLKVLKAGEKRAWITTRSYKHTLAPLEQEFGTPYTLEPFDVEGTKYFLKRYFSINSSLEKLNYDQFENIYSFMKDLSISLRLHREPHREFIPVMSVLLQIVYVCAAEIFKSDINHVTPSILNEKIKKEFDIDLNEYSSVDKVLGRSPDDEQLELAGTPILVYMVAKYFNCRIKDFLSFKLDKKECKNKWDLIMDTCTLYRNFIEDEMNRFLNDDDDIETFADNKRNFLNKHKKLGLFIISRENDLTKLLKEEEITEIQKTIERIKTGEEQSFLIDCIVDDKPRFTHLILAEYFAVECLTEMLKQLNRDTSDNMLKNPSIWQSILNILLFNAPPGIRSAFNYKLQSDSALAEVTKSDMCQKVLFEMLIKKQSNESGTGTSRDTIAAALQDSMFNVANLFLSTMQGSLNHGNVEEVVSLVKETRSIISNFGSEYKGVLDDLLDSVKVLDGKKVSRIIESGALTEVPLRHANEYCSSPAVGELTKRVADVAKNLSPSLHQLTTELPAFVSSIEQVVSSLPTVFRDVLQAEAEKIVQASKDRSHDSS